MKAREANPSNMGLRRGSPRSCQFCYKDFTPRVIQRSKDTPVFGPECYKVGVDVYSYVCPYCKEDNWRRGLPVTVEKAEGMAKKFLESKGIK